MEPLEYIRMYLDLNESMNRSNPYSHAGVLKRTSKGSKSGHIRSNDVFGLFNLPEIGKPFIILARPFDESISENEGFRTVISSLVVKINQKSYNQVLFETENSCYKLDVTEVSQLH